MTFSKCLSARISNFYSRHCCASKTTGNLFNIQAFQHYHLHMALKYLTDILEGLEFTPSEKLQMLYEVHHISYLLE